MISGIILSLTRRQEFDCRTNFFSSSYTVHKNGRCANHKKTLWLPWQDGKWFGKQGQGCRPKDFDKYNLLKKPFKVCKTSQSLQIWPEFTAAADWVFIDKAISVSLHPRILITSDRSHLYFQWYSCVKRRPKSVTSNISAWIRRPKLQLILILKIS